tara:strand:- start:475 stop:837 length:363 start_codon:yes stop_codon:yes gene_type:complete
VGLKKGSMKKIVLNLSLLIFLTGCAESMALLGPATSMGGGNLMQSSITSAVGYGVKKETGKSPIEHAVNYLEKHNPENKKEKCVNFLESTSNEFCMVVKKRVSEIHSSIVEKSKIKFLDK